MLETIKKEIIINKKQNEWIENNNISLGKLVRQYLDEVMKHSTTKYEMLQMTNMVELKCINTTCKHFSHCGCLACNVFKNHPKGCKEFIPCKPIPKW